MRTNRARSMEHANAKIPQKKPAIVAHTAKPIGLFVTAPRVKSHRRYPGVVPLASCNNLALWERPDRDKVILTTRHNVLAIRGPADTDQAAVVAAKDVQNPN